MIDLDLRDIHLPAEIPWWPLAPGWWLSLLLLILFAGVIWWVLRRRHHPLRQNSLKELTRIRAAYRTGLADSQLLAEVSQLLRRIAISHRGRDKAASISGDDWRDCLLQLSPGINFDAAQLDLLTRGRYRPNPDCDIDSLLSTCEKWIRALPRGGGHVST